VKADQSKRVTYGELIGGGKLQRHADRRQRRRETGTAKVKPGQELHDVGQLPQRYDIPAKWTAR